jgi:Cu+-exporting ATPase
MKVVELDVEGMTCAACAARIEKNLNGLDGVEASVNLATEKATVRFDPAAIALEGVIQRVRDSGYDAQVAREGEIRDHSAEHRRARNAFVIAAILSAPLLLHGLVPGWLQFALATPVQFWSGARFYRGAWKALRGGAANMDVLVALGTSVAYAFSAVVLLFGVQQHLYFEAAAIVITLVLLGKYLEVRAKARAAQSLESLIRLQPKTAYLERDGKLVEVNVASLHPGDEFVVRPGDAIACRTSCGSGDNPQAVERTADELGIERWKAGILPEEKAREIESLREEGRYVGMAGDGVNDAPALAAADVSFALASGRAPRSTWPTSP